MRRDILRYWPYMLLLPVLFAFAGCGSMPANTVGSSGTGADAGPWPTAPARSTATNGTDPNAIPNTPVLVVLRATAPADEELRLAVTGVQIRSGGNWFALAKASDIKASYPKAIRAGAKGIAALLAKNSKVPKRKYNALQLLLDNGNSVLVTSDGNQPLVLKNTQFELKDWQPDEKKPWNVLVITLDGAKVTVDQNGATLPAEAISEQTEEATGSIAGKLVPVSPTSRVEAFWGDSKISLGTAVPSAADGSFTIKDLPDGPYTLNFTTPGYRLTAPLKAPVIVAKNKAITLDDITLTPDTAQHQ